jgi:hypothetical protein
MLHTVKPSPWMALCLWSAPAWAAPDVLRSPEGEALQRDFKVLKTVEADLDGDGKAEHLLLFRDQGNGGGLMMMKARGSAFRQLGCLYLEGHTPLDAELNGKDLAVTLENIEKPLLLTVGKELGLRDGEGDPFAGVKVTASSTLKGGEHAAANAYDQALTTSWAEGKDGTGIGESLTLEFKKPVAVGMVGIFSGAAGSAKEFKESNRMRRAVLEVQSPSNVGDDSANLDFADLGIESGGHKAEVALANKQEMKFVRLTEEDVVRLTIRVESVYLGDKKDDTHITEVSVCQLLVDSQVQQLLKKKKPAASSVKAP